MNTERFNDLVTAYNHLKTSLEKHKMYSERPKHYDKVGLGFNKDSRFAVVKIVLSLDSWVGTYGNSGCTTALSIGARKDLFNKYFVDYLNTHIKHILADVCERMEDDIVRHRNEEIKALESRIKNLRSVKGENA